MRGQLTQKKINRFRRFIEFRDHSRAFAQQTLSSVKSFDQLFVIVMAILIGVTAGYISAGFRTLISTFRQLMWGEGTLLDVVQAAPLYLKIGIPVIGLVVVAAFVQRFAPEAKGHGVPEVMDAVATRNGFIRMRVVLVKALASAFSIASGAAVGREGPIVQIGSAFGSTIGQIFHVSQRRMKTFIGCGAAAGIAATFNAPIAGALFASEIILGDFSAVAVGPIIIASVFGTVITRGIYGDFPAFIPPVYTLNSSIEIIFYIILGVVTGLAGWLFVKTLYLSEDLFDKWKTHVAVKAFAGGLLLAAMAIFMPHVMGVGYESMDIVLVDKMPFILAGALVFGKIIATSVSLGAGASGGIFAPSLFMGSMLGGFVGAIFNYFFPEITAPPGAYALVAMAAMVAATTHAPVTAILIIFEMTTEYTIILPLMVTSIIAMIISSRLLDGNIYTIKLKRRGVDIHTGKDVNILKKLEVIGLKQQLVKIVREDTSVNELLKTMSNSDQSVFYVCHENQQLTGIITTGMVRRFLDHMEHVPDDTFVSEIQSRKFPHINDRTPINEVLQQMLDADLLAIPVVDDNGCITGQVLRRDILQAYQEVLLQSQAAGTLASQMKFIHQNHYERSEVIPGYLMARINAPSRFVGQALDQVNSRTRYQVDILLVRRDSHDGSLTSFMPVPNTRIKSGDQLIIFGQKTHVDALSQ